MAAPNISTPVEQLLGRLKKVRRSGSGWVALCPAHEDQNASLSITTGRDGRALVNCHAGCSSQAIVGAIGLTLSDLFAEPIAARPAQPVASTRPRMVKSYDYTDADGKLLFQTCRFEPKTFRQRRPDGNNGWIWNLGDTPPVLYQLPKVLAAATDGKTVFVVEGEKDADTLIDMGYAATTAPMGAGKWREAFADALKGSDVVILPDNDDTGRAHAEQVAASLTNAGCRVRIAILPGLPSKGDVTDWFSDPNNDLDQFGEIIGKTPRWTADKMEQKHRTRWRLDELWENDSIMRPPPPVVPRLAWAGRSTLLASREKAGKSTLVGYIAAMVSQGGRFLGERCEQGDVLIIGLEENAGDLARRLKMFGADATKVHIVIGFNGDPKDRARELEAHIDAVDPLLVIVDTLAAYSNGLADDDNSASQMTATVQPITALAHSRGVALILVHHARKMDGRARGSTAITASTDVVCEFWAPDEDADPTLRRMRSKGRVPVVPQYDLRFDGDTYTLDTGDAPLDQRVVEFIRHHPGTTLSNLRDMVKGKFEDISATVARLVAAKMILTDGEGRGRRLHIREVGNGWERDGNDVEPSGNGGGSQLPLPEGEGLGNRKPATRRTTP